MTIIEIEIVDLQAEERGVARLDDVFAREAGLVGLVVFPAEENLAGNEEAAAPPAGFFEDGAHDELGLAVGVSLGVVEEIDPGVVGGVQ